MVYIVGRRKYIRFDQHRVVFVKTLMAYIRKHNIAHIPCVAMLLKNRRPQNTIKWYIIVDKSRDTNSSLHIHTCIHMHAYIHIHQHTYGHTGWPIHKHIHTGIHTYTYKCIHAYIQSYAYTGIPEHRHIYIHPYIIYIYMRIRAGRQA